MLDEPDGTCRVGERGDGVLDVVLAGHGHRQRIDDRADHISADAVVPKYEPEDRDEDDCERRNGEQDAIGDSGRLLGAVIRIEALSRVGDDPRQLCDDLDRPAQDPWGPRPTRLAAGTGGFWANMGTVAAVGGWPTMAM